PIYKKKRARKNNEDSEDEDDEHFGSDEDDSDDDRGGGRGYYENPAHTAMMEARMFEFFGRVEKRELLDTLMCTEEQADTIIEFRPFLSVQDLHTKFEIHKRGKKKINKLLEKYQTLMEGYSQVDRLIDECEKRGGEVLGVMERWIEKGAASSPLKKAPPPVADPVASKDETGSNESLEEDTGLHLTGVVKDEAAAEQLENEKDANGKFLAEKCLNRQPENLNEKMKLKGYQLVGVSWLNLLYSKGLGGILADEMGLGKTAQVIAFISLLKAQGDEGSPHLIIVPSSTLENWLREFQNWSPDIRVLSYYGSQPERENIRYNVIGGELANYDVIITTYNLASSKEDRSFLKKIKPRSMILDEGHMVKNMARTPLQNNLMELLSLLTFIMPKIFADDEEALKQIFTLKNTASNDATVLNRQRIQRAKMMMTPFVLRRKKDNVLTELPKKVRTEIFCTMTEGQNKLYQSIIADCKKNMFEKADAIEAAAAAAAAPPPPPEPVVEDEDEDELPSSKRRRGAPPKKKPAPPPPPPAPAAPKQVGDNTNVLMQLRKAANHPLLFRRQYSDEKLSIMAREIMSEEQYLEANYDYIKEDMMYMSDFELHKLCNRFQSIEHHALCNEEWMDAGKVQWLKENLPDMIKNGDRVLIFSQFVIMLDVLEAVMTTLGISFLRLDGSTNVVDRQSLIDQYNDDSEIGVFLLSTRAGGLGLNLTSSNVVIIYDMDFNPHNDAQAEDRAHRVGQVRDVRVMKLIVNGTVENHILKLSTIKLKLDKSLQQKNSVEEVEEGEGEAGDEDPNAKKGKGRGRKKEDPGNGAFVEESAPSAADDKKLMEMLRSEWMESGATI
ncbi:hypothetical protein HDU99_000233, partial [Rhizoclosmatium hyalinum]